MSNPRPREDVIAQCERCDIEYRRNLNAKGWQYRCTICVESNKLLGLDPPSWMKMQNVLKHHNMHHAQGRGTSLAEGEVHDDDSAEATDDDMPDDMDDGMHMLVTADDAEEHADLHPPSAEPPMQHGACELPDIPHPPTNDEQQMVAAICPDPDPPIDPVALDSEVLQSINRVDNATVAQFLSDNPQLTSHDRAELLVRHTAFGLEEGDLAVLLDDGAESDGSVVDVADDDIADIDAALERASLASRGVMRPCNLQQSNA
jgi:hypothetical protein